MTYNPKAGDRESITSRPEVTSAGNRSGVAIADRRAGSTGADITRMMGVNNVVPRALPVSPRELGAVAARLGWSVGTLGVIGVECR